MDKRRSEGDGPAGFITVACPLRGELLRVITAWGEPCGNEDRDKDEDEDEDEDEEEASRNKSSIGPSEGRGEAKGDPRGEARGGDEARGDAERGWRSQIFGEREYRTWRSRGQVGNGARPDIIEA
jgi:hypothetical protein